MKITASSKKSLIMAVIAVVLSVAVFFAAVFGGGSVVFGWFTTGARSLDVGGFNGSIRSGTLNATYSVYAYNEARARASTHYINEETGGEGEAISMSDISLAVYDRTFTMRNRHVPVIIRIQISDTQIPESGAISVRLTRNPAMLDDATGQTVISRRCSSVTRYALLADASLMTAAAASNDPDTTLYNAINNTYYSAMQAATMGTTFVTKNTSTNPATYDKASQITLNCTYTSSTWNGSTLNLYIYVTYDAPMIDDYLEQNISVGGNNSGEDSMENDLSKLILILGEVEA